MTGSSEHRSTVVVIPGTPDEQSISEYYVGCANRKIVYPGIDQCLSITAYTPNGLIGTHISPGSDKANVKLHFQTMMNAGAGKCMLVYIAGNFEKHAQWTKAEWKSIEKVVADTRKYLSKYAPVYVTDTTPTDATLPFGLDIIASWSSTGVNLTYKKAYSKSAPIQPIADPTVRY